MPARLEKSGPSRRSDVAAAGLRHSRAPLKCRDELRRELATPAEDVAPRLVDDIQLLAVEGFHHAFLNVKMTSSLILFCNAAPDDLVSGGGR